MNDVLNKQTIALHEGNRLTAYRDTRGFLTVARGFNLDAGNAARICAQVEIDFAAVRGGQPITAAQSDAIFAVQYATVATEARAIFPEIDSYPEDAGAVICDMLFQLGDAGFLAFTDTIAAFKARNYVAAIEGIEHSALATETPHRVAMNVLLLRSIESTQAA